MQTNFFQYIAPLNLTGDLQINISKGADNGLIVSVLLQNETCGDEAKKLIPPLILRGTAEELDSGFFEKVTAPMQTVSGLMVNMEAFTKQLEEAKKHSAIEKAKTDKEKKAKEEKDKKFRDAMAKADELEKEGKYRDAWLKLPEPADFPEQAEDIRKRRTALSAKFAPDLFHTPAAETATSKLQQGNTLFHEDTDHEEDADEAEGDFEEDNETE